MEKIVKIMDKAISELNDAMGNKAAVYKTDDNWFFSDAVKREFGENRLISMFVGDDAFCSVMPLKVDPKLHNMEICGTVEI